METTTLPSAPALADPPRPLDENTLRAYRRLGFLLADLDPMNRIEPESQPGLENTDPATAELARRAYCGTIGAEFMHIPQAERRQWIEARLEGEPAPVPRDRILELLTRADLFETMLQQRYLGSKRFSLEGVEALLPCLDQMLEGASAHRAVQVVMAMSHRGRLNVMAHTVGRGATALFAAFEDMDPRGALGGGDVKYHQGATGKYVGTNGHEVGIHLVSNPSHLEAVDPVAAGRVKAKQDRLGADGALKVFPIVMHGDSAFAGQGILAETLNLAEVDGFNVGGTVHLIVNNLIGFTTEPKAYGSSRFASDVARRLPIPIFHVNGDDPEAVARVARLAVDYRYAFHSDVVIDLIGFRRHGHSEVDDPTITQPVLYKKIDAHPPLWKLYGPTLGLPDGEAERRAEAVRAELDAAHKAAATLGKKPELRNLPAYWDPFKGGPWLPQYDEKTGLAAEEVAALAARLTAVPEGFHLHKKTQKLLAERAEMGAGKRPFDYAMAEALAFASLVKMGIPVRFSGQDTRRGTFNQRHSVLIDVETAAEHTPLQHIAPNQARFGIYDSVLSEAAVLGFEYGYSRDYPDALVLWEAQFGDFANGAQIIVDQFITASEDKWVLLSGVVMLLPHGFEGQGPEHSSARLERYLQLCAEHNIQVCQPSNAAQYFHLLRRQALSPWRKPLVVMTPKSMLRHKDTASTLEDLGRERFRKVVGDPDLQDAKRVLLCTGKIGHELKRERAARKDASTAVVFLDQLYPFPKQELAEEMARHPNARDVVWVQEEPENMGALFFIRHRIERLLGRRIRVIKRSASGSPATGSAKAHALEQQTLLTLAFTTGNG